MLPYRNLSSHLREKYGSRLKKICIDGGFTCPNRDGTCGVGGCIFCSERGSGDHIVRAKSIGEQVTSALEHAKEGERFIAYFQNFTGTYAPRDVLKERYESALCDGRIVALDIGTRPDCITEEIADLLASFRDRVDLTVELGLQSANDETAKRINRGYGWDTFVRAFGILRERGIPIVVHLMLGLPGEDARDYYATAEKLAALTPDGVKIHSVYVCRGTVLAGMYGRGEYVPITLEDYVEGAIGVLCRLPADTVIHRLTGDCPKDALIAPAWNAEKSKILAMITSRMEQRSLTQGCMCKQ